MNITDAFPSTYLKAADLAGQRVKVTIARVGLEDIGNKEMKLVMHFLNKDKGIILNKTNAFILGEAFGAETDAWVGQPITLYSHMVNFNGQMVPGLAVQASVPGLGVQARMGTDIWHLEKGKEAAALAQSAGHNTQPGDQLQALADQVNAAEQEKAQQDAANQAIDDTDIPF